MSGEPVHPAVRRILREHGGDGVLTALASRMSGSDLTALLLEVVRRRAAVLTPTQVLDRYLRDRFVRPAPVDMRRLLEMELLALDTVDPPFVPVTTSPLVPLGTHSVVAGVHQDRVVTTVRGSEVAADPTSSLALEAATRRKRLLASDARSGTAVHLASVARVVRAQRFEGPRSFAHFSLLGLVTAGRDVGNDAFEEISLRHHLQAQIAVCRRAGFGLVHVQLTDFGGRHRAVIDGLGDLASDEVTVTTWPERTAARGYYPSLCFKLSVVSGGDEVELGDGGLVDWTQALVGSGKERLMTSGLSVERLAILAGERP